MLFLFIIDADELSSRLMHTIIDIRNDENGRVVLQEAQKDNIENPLNLRCIYFEELLSKYKKHYFSLTLLNSIFKIRFKNTQRYVIEKFFHQKKKETT